MERFQECREEALRKLRSADHMLGTTYPLLKDPKLLLAVLENLHAALDLSVAALVHYERLWRRIPPFHDTFDMRLQIFSTQLARRLEVPPEYMQLVSTVRELYQSHKRAPVEFARHNQYVMCSDHYSVKTLSERDLKAHVAKAKSFQRVLDEVMSRHDVVSP